ncbi:histidine--tRNA ligase [Methylovirgula sp. HY1]|uniref:histidine--tRNA ligase n=1 Tax=Methylovirgula sp. HY1 TaxID=2822761 RepID=UPI001C5BD35D|nr:histidine--tRNA ligase [Methylovirgula sp. HY1]QXX75605.1 Histidine--tRNA ligase [Methylovirgula sp. HY1]
MNDAKKPAARTAARLPRGLIDRGPADLAATEKMLAAIKKVYQLYGFEAVETPFIEYTEALGKFLPDQDRPNEGVFSFQDDDEQWLSLRYDLTAPLARYVAENFDRLPKPYRSYRAGYVFRNEKPGPGRFRQFMQFDADTVGSASPAADAELCMMAADTLEALGIKRGDYVIKVNNRKVLDGVLEAIGLGGDENAGRRLIVLRAMDKFDKFGDEVRLLLGEGRKDESGDFTKGANLKADQQREIMTLLHSNAQLVDVSSLSEAMRADAAILADAPQNAFSNNETLKIFGAHFGYNKLVSDGLAELQAIADICAAAGYGTRRIRIDPSVVRGLEYYTGPVFEAELTFEIDGEDGKPIRFGSIGGGGRFDGLVARFRGEPVPATGFSIGVSRLYAALKAINSPIVSGAEQRGPVVVLVLDKEEIGRYQKFVSALRNEGIAAELYLGSAGMNAQLKYADKRGSICAIIQGSNEREKGEIAIRDLMLGAELAAMTKDRADYLELRAKAQFTVPEADLVKAVKEVLGRHS